MLSPSPSAARIQGVLAAYRKKGEDLRDSFLTLVERKGLLTQLHVLL